MFSAPCDARFSQTRTLRYSIFRDPGIRAESTRSSPEAVQRAAARMDRLIETDAHFNRRGDSAKDHDRSSIALLDRRKSVACHFERKYIRLRRLDATRQSAGAALGWWAQ